MVAWLRITKAENSKELSLEGYGSDADFGNIEPNRKKKCLSLKRSKKSVEGRFKMSSPEIAKAKKGFIPDIVVHNHDIMI